MSSQPTPQIVTMDPSGYHNADLAAAHSRVLNTGSWKRQRVIMLIPAGKSVPSKAALSWMNLYFPPNNGVVRWLCMNMEVGEAYSAAISQILSDPELSQWEYLFTLEHDNCPPPDAVVKLIGHLERNPDLACVQAAYWTKGPEGVLQAWGDPSDPVTNYRPLPPDPNGGLVHCRGTGMGCNLWRLSMFKDDRLRKPWFRTLNGLNNEGCATQDLYFWGDAAKYGYKCAVACDVKCGHYDVENDFMW